MGAGIEYEMQIVRRVERLMADLGPFISLAEAAKMTGVPLQTLSEAVRKKRVPALRVQSRRWLVRPIAVQLYFGMKRERDDIREKLQQLLVDEGYLAATRPPKSRILSPFRPLVISGKPASKTLLEDRR
jgi:excisionase family DNA binding protein